MGEISHNLDAIEDKSKNHSVEKSPEAQRVFEQLFQDDYLEQSDKEYDTDSSENEKIDSNKKMEVLFADDYEGMSNKRAELNTYAVEKYEYDENGTRELTEEEKQELIDTLGWSEDKINQKCRIDADGVVHYKCREEKENDSGIEYVTKTIDIKEIKIEVTVPKFDSKFDTYLSEGNYQSSNTKQFAECNKKLKETVENDPDLKSQFTDEQLEDIKNGDTPRGYTWHHNEEPGKMQLVNSKDHDQCIGGAPHTGGNALWGNKTSNRKQEGETF